MKSSFHVSTLPAFWERGLKKKYIAEPYVANYYNLTASDDIFIAEYTRKNKQDYITDSIFLEKKVKPYRHQIIANLNSIHQTQYSSKFWTKALGMCFNRFVHMLYDGYKIASQFNPKKHDIYVLDKESYCSFQDFDEFRQLFQRDNFGFEQMFSLYIDTFYPEIYKKNCIKVNYPKIEKSSLKPKTTSVKKQSLLSRWKHLTLRQLYHRLIKKIFFWNKPVVAIFESYFSRENMDKLYRKSHVRIDPIKFDYKHRIDSTLDKDIRKQLCSGFASDDRFDQFFEKAVATFFPTLYVESFSDTMHHYQQQVQKHKQLKYVISEGWIGNSRMAFLIAVLQMRGVYHIYNEHNYLQQFLLGNHIKQLQMMCDQYYSLGWKDKKYQKVIAGASLFASFEPTSPKQLKEINYLYIPAYPAVKMPEINCSYGQNQENATRYMDYIGIFFASLSANIIKQFIFRFYPIPSDWLEYNFKQAMNVYTTQMKGIDNCKISSKEQMLKSRLVIIDYLSTSYLEALIMNVPTVILFDASRYFIDEDSKDFFKVLIEVGVVQTSPRTAAEFINNLGDNIEQWWDTQVVQVARQQFLDKNIGKPDDAIDYYLSLLKK